MDYMTPNTANIIKEDDSMHHEKENEEGKNVDLSLWKLGLFFLLIGCIFWFFFDPFIFKALGVIEIISGVGLVFSEIITKSKKVTKTVGANKTAEKESKESTTDLTKIGRIVGAGMCLIGVVMFILAATTGTITGYQGIDGTYYSDPSAVGSNDWMGTPGFLLAILGFFIYAKSKAFQKD